MAGKFMSKMMDIIGLEEEYEEEEEFYEDEIEEVPAPRSRREKPRYRDEEPARKPELRPRASIQRERDIAPERSVRREEPVQFNERKRRKAENAGGASDVKLVVYKPLSYDDAQNIIDNLVSNKPIIVNLDELDKEVAQRVLDFMSGAAYAQNGSVMKVSRGIFLLAPNNVDVLGNLEDDMRANDFFNLGSALE